MNFRRRFGKVAKGTPRKRHVAGVMNGMERAYAGELDARKGAGEVLEYWFESHRFKLAGNTFYTPDFVVMLADGTLAFVRGIDYRIDYRNADGTWTSSPKVPYDWQPMPDSSKEKLVDSVRTAQNKAARAARRSGSAITRLGSGFRSGFCWAGFG